MTALSSIENVIGSSRNDALYGDAGNNVLDGGVGGAISSAAEPAATRSAMQVRVRA